MTDKLKGGTKAWHQRQRVWRHNAFSGSARMMEMQLLSIVNSDSVSSGTKHIANKILVIIPLLKEGLKTRIDP